MLYQLSYGGRGREHGNEFIYGFIYGGNEFIYGFIYGGNEFIYGFIYGRLAYLKGYCGIYARLPVSFYDRLSASLTNSSPCSRQQLQ